MKLYNLTSEKIKKIEPQDITVAVYGLGKMGLPLASVFASKGFNVIGADVNPKVVDSINKGICTVVGETGLDELLKSVVKNKKLQATTDLVKASKESDVKIILVPTYLDDNNNADLSILKSVTENIGKGLHKGDIVILESTAPPGTTIDLIGRTLEKTSGLKLNKDFGVAHCPERTSSGKAIFHITGGATRKVVGGSDKKTTQIIKHIYEKINAMGVVVVKDITVAEMVKISEGLYRDVNLALANNLYLICRELGINGQEVINAANTDIVCHLLNPGPGVGGHCIPVYPYFVLNKIKTNKELLTLSRTINDSMSQHVIDLARTSLKKKGIDIRNARILVLGFAYRAGVKETRKSPGLKIAYELKNITPNVYAYDPWFNKNETKQFGLMYRNDFTDIDCLIITTAEEEFRKYDWRKIAQKMKTKIIIQGGNIIDIDMLRSLGFLVQRIGYAD